MTLQELNKESILALKEKNTVKRSVLTMVIANTKRAAIDAGVKEADITEEFVNAQLTKYLKSLNETRDALTGKGTVEQLLAIQQEIDIVSAYAPVLITDPEKIKEILDGLTIAYEPKNRGLIMKAVSRWWKGKVDMKVVSAVLNDLMK